MTADDRMINNKNKDKEQDKFTTCDAQAADLV